MCSYSYTICVDISTLRSEGIDSEEVTERLIVSSAGVSGLTPADYPPLRGAGECSEGT
jgi:hypothetical protein